MLPVLHAKSAKSAKSAKMSGCARAFGKLGTLFVFKSLGSLATFFVSANFSKRQICTTTNTNSACFSTKILRSGCIRGEKTDMIVSRSDKPGVENSLL